MISVSNLSLDHFLVISMSTFSFGMLMTFVLKFYL